MESSKQIVYHTLLVLHVLRIHTVQVNFLQTYANNNGHGQYKLFENHPSETRESSKPIIDICLIVIRGNTIFEECFNHKVQAFYMTLQQCLDEILKIFYLLILWVYSLLLISRLYTELSTLVEWGNNSSYHFPIFFLSKLPGIKLTFVFDNKRKWQLPNVIALC